MYSRWPAIDDASRVSTSSRPRARRSSSSTALGRRRSGPATAPGQNTRPTTAAAWSARFSVGRSRSMRAARTALHRVGDLDLLDARGGPPAAAVVHDQALVDQPPDDLLEEERVALGALEDPRRAPLAGRSSTPSSSATSCVGFRRRPADRARRSTTLRLPPPQPGRRRESGRAATGRGTAPALRPGPPAPPAGRAARASAQWMSSITTIDRPATGRAPRRTRATPRGPRRSPSAGRGRANESAGIVEADRVGEGGRRRARSAELGRQQSSPSACDLLERELAVASVSRTPACALRISASGQ